MKDDSDLIWEAYSPKIVNEQGADRVHFLASLKDFIRQGNTDSAEATVERLVTDRSTPNRPGFGGVLLDLGFKIQPGEDRSDEDKIIDTWEIVDIKTGMVTDWTFQERDDDIEELEKKVVRNFINHKKPLFFRGYRG